MKSLLVSWLCRGLYALLSNPQRVRFVVTTLALIFLLAALVLPSLATLADPISGGVGH